MAIGRGVAVPCAKPGADPRAAPEDEQRDDEDEQGGVQWIEHCILGFTVKHGGINRPIDFTEPSHPGMT